MPEHETIINCRRFYTRVELLKKTYDRRKVYIEARRNDSTKMTHSVRLFFTMYTFMVDARWSKIWIANEVVRETRPLVFSVKESVPLDSPERSLALHRRFNRLSKARRSARERLPFYALLLFSREEAEAGTMSKFWWLYLASESQPLTRVSARSKF